MSDTDDDDGPDTSNIPINGNWVAAHLDTTTNRFSELLQSGQRIERYWKLSRASSVNLSDAYQHYLDDGGLYFQLSPADFTAYFDPMKFGIGSGINTNLTAVFISVNLYDAIGNRSFSWPTLGFNGELIPVGSIPVRNADGLPQLVWGFAGRSKTLKDKNEAFWMTLLQDSFPTLRVAQRSFSRAINPAIKLDVVLLHRQHFNATEFAIAVRTVLTDPDSQCRQQIRILDRDNKEHQKIMNESKLISTSPYGDFQVFMDPDTWKSYLNSRPDRELPTPITLANAARLPAKPLNIANGHQSTDAQARAQAASALIAAQRGATPQTLTPTIPVSARTMAKKQLRATAQGQFTVMGFSATDAAAVLQWTNPRTTITTSNGWPGGFYPSEWLHKVGYSYGRPIAETQSTSNLVFGSSETNSVMTRWESAFQQYLLNEAKFRREIRKETREQAQRNSTGDLDIHELNEKIIKRNLPTSHDRPYFDVEVDLRQLNIVNAKPYWLWYGLKYGFKREAKGGVSPLSAPEGRYETFFYTFQRPFITYFETALDNVLRNILYTKRAIGQQGSRIAAAKMQGMHRRAAFVSAPEDFEAVDETDVFNINALTSVLLSIGRETPAIASNSRLPGLVRSTAPQNLTHSQLWLQAIGGQAVIIGGVELAQPAVVSVDNSGRLIEIPVTSLSAPVADIQVRQISEQQAPRRLAQSPASSTISPFLATNGLPGLGEVNRLVQSSLEQSIPPGFVLVGDMELFGLIAAKFYSFQGTSAGSGVQEMVAVTSDLSLGKLMPDLVGDFFDSIGLQHVQLEYFDIEQDGKPPGLWFEADVVFEGILQPAGEILGALFNQDHPILQMQSLFGTERDWNKLSLPAGFTVTGTFKGISVFFGDFLEFNSVGVEITVDERYKTVPTYKKVHELSYEFFGTAHMTVPGSATPLNVNFNLTKDDTLLSLSVTIQDEIWEDAFGVMGLTLSEVRFTAEFDMAHAGQSLVFSFEALLKKGEEFVALRGFFMKGDWLLAADIEYIDLDSIINMFGKVIGGDLPEFDHDVEMDILSLQIDPSGISLMGKISVDDFSTAEASIEITRSGINIAGSVGNVELDGVTIKEASLEIAISPRGQKEKPVHFGINGKVDFGGLEISATLYIDKQPSKPMQWTIYGEYNIPITSATLAPNLEGTFLDLPMSRIALIAGNADQPVSGFVNKYNYPIIKGIQLCAAVKSIDALNQLTRVNMDGLILRVGLIAGAGLDFGIILPMDKAISFGPNITSGPISVDLEITNPPSLGISAGLNIITAGSAEPLIFKMSLLASMFDASATAEFIGYWVNPLGLGESIKIGPNMALQMEILYATFLTTGIPSKLAIGGGLTIGKTEAQVALSFGNNPKEELISASIDKLSLEDLVKFASQIAGEDIPLPDEGSLNFEQIALYMSTGVTIGSNTYPPGISFAASMELLGRKAMVSALIQQGIQLEGSLEGFNIGPLVLKGATTPDAQLQLSLTPKKQHFLIDGGTTLLDIGASIHLEADLLPKPNFEFILTLAFTELLPFTITGKMIDEFNGVDDLDFYLNALLEQKILNYLISQANMQLVVAQKAAKEGYESTQASLDQAEASFKESIERAEASLAEARASWNAKSDSVQQSINQINLSTEQGKAKLEADIQSALAAFTEKVNAAQQSLEQTRATSAAAIQSAEADLTKVTAETAAKIDELRRDLVGAQQSMDSTFGDTIRSVQGAKDSVQSAQRDVSGATDQVSKAQSDYDHASFLQKPKMAANLAAAKTVKAAKEAALAAANGALSVALSVLNGAGYQAALGALEAYKQSLNAAEKAAPVLIDAAKSALEATRNTQDAAVSAASSALEDIKSSSTEAALLEGANAALNAFMEAQAKLLEEASAALEALSDSIEFITFTTAEKALAFAKSNTSDLDIARHALEIANMAQNAALQATEWMVNHVGNFFNLTTVELTGTLKGLCDNGEPMKAHIVGMVADQPVDVSLDYSIGRTPDMIKDLFEHLWGLLLGGLSLPVR